MPSLHLVGTNEFLRDSAIALTTKFLNPVVIIHSDGHKFPKLSMEERKVVLKFIDYAMKGK